MISWPYFDLAASDANGDLLLARLMLRAAIFGQPEQRFLEFIEGPNVPATQCADECKEPYAVMRIGFVKHCEPLAFAEAGLVKGFDQLRQFVGRKGGLGWNRDFANIEQRAINAAFATRVGQFAQCGLA